MRLRMHSAVFFQGAQRLRSVVGAVASCTVQVTRKLFQSALPEAWEKKKQGLQNTPPSTPKGSPIESGKMISSKEVFLK